LDEDVELEEDAELEEDEELEELEEELEEDEELKKDEELLGVFAGGALRLPPPLPQAIRDAVISVYVRAYFGFIKGSQGMNEF
jgi:non-canonical (house-cleaning) NTP pyrophosphatase